MAKILTNQDLEALGLAIARRREELDISQEEAAFRSGLHRSYLGDVECGKRNLSIQSLMKICKGLDISAADLFRQANL